MSVCRWSSDDFQCDVYVWADVYGGYCTEVASNHVEWLVELPPPVHVPVGAADSEERHAWATAHIERWTAVGKLLDDESTHRRVAIPEPEGGRSYQHDTAGECADNLERLRALGINVPQSAIDALRLTHADEEVPC
jgi:hypothetical protein